MCYLTKTEYRIIPTAPFKIIRNCPGCGAKMIYGATGNFRVNANGGRHDVWLIYQCEKCHHSYNLTLYERIKIKSLTAAEYRCFQENDAETVLRYGTDNRFFSMNKAEIAWDEVAFDVSLDSKIFGEDAGSHSDLIVLANPYLLKIRTERIIAGILHISRSQAHKLLLEGMGDGLEGKCPKYIGSVTALTLMNQNSKQVN